MTCMDASVDGVRADRAMPGTYRLAPRDDLPSGQAIFEAVVSTPGVNRYPQLGTAEWVSDEALSDPAYLNELVGMPLIDASDEHWPGIDNIDDLEAYTIGAVLSARWDPEQRATIARILVDRKRGLSAIRERGITGVSLRYTPDLQEASEAPDGTPITHIQTARKRLNHLLLTANPNDPPARIRADEMETPPMAEIPDWLSDRVRADMDPMAMFAALLEMLAEVRSDAASYMARAESAEASLAGMQAKADAVAEADADDAPRADESDAATAGDWRIVLDLARTHDVSVEDGATLDAARRAVVAAALPARADAADVAPYIDALAVSSDARADARRDVWTELARRAPSQPADGGITHYLNTGA